MSGDSRRTHPRSPTGSADSDFVLTLWTSDVDLARQADAAGVDRVGVDLERIGKAERQQGLATWLSPHTENDLRAVGTVLRRAALFARVNPVNGATPLEVESVLAAGAAVLMLPMVVDPATACRFVELVGGRARVVLLVEHIGGLNRLDELVAIPGVDEIHIGLNDLGLSLGLRNRWLALADDLLAGAGARVRAAGLRFGLGGIARVDDDDLPVPSDLVYAQYARTGATAALISRSFLGPDAVAASLGREISRARRRLAAWYRRSPHELDLARRDLARHALAAVEW